MGKPKKSAEEDRVEDLLQPDFDAVAKHDDDEDVWFDADQLASASRVELGSGGVLGASYSREDLARDRARVGVDLGILPGWPGAGPSGHGWGVRLSQLVGGVHPGHRIMIDAEHGGSGRTGLVLQLADGLALRNAVGRGADDPLTPVVLLAEDGRQEIGRRAVARWTGRELGIFRHGEGGAGRFSSHDAHAVAAAFDEADAALDGPLAALRAHQRVAAPDARGAELVELLVEHLGVWRQRLEGSAPVWPVLVTDGLSRWASDASVAARDALGSALSDAARRFGWIWLSTERGVGGDLDPDLDLRLLLRSDTDGELTALVAHNRTGPSGGMVRFRWDRACGRYEPID